MKHKAKDNRETVTLKEKIKKILVEKNLDGVLISDPYNMRYISGFCGGTGYLYLSENKSVVLTDSRYTTAAKQEAQDFKVVEVDKGRDYYKAVFALVLEDKVKRLGFESENISYSDYLEWEKSLKDVVLVPLKDEFTRLRSIKSDWEIERLHSAERIGDKAFEKILGIIKPGMTELSVAAHLEFIMKQEGAENTSFDTIAASGINSAMPHAIPGNKVIEAGDFLTMDFGCVYEGYCSDMTRTVVVGKASKKQKEVYDTVKRAQKEALDFLKAGYKGKEVDKVARDVIKKAGYGKYFGHGLGHSVGLYIHENPRLSPTEEGIIEEGMIETVEPGIYIPGFGGVRIEDMVVVTRDGIRNLTASPKELIEI